MASTEQLACVYSALLLNDLDASVTADKIKAILKAANVTCEPYWPGIFAKALESLNLGDLVSNVGAGAPAQGGGAAGGAAASAGESKEDAKAEEKKEEDEDSDGDMGFGLFD